MKYLLIIAMLFMVGCSMPEYEVDVVKREKIFFRCLTAIPNGPTHTKYNDWDDVVSVCGDQAYIMSLACVKNCYKENK